MNSRERVIAALERRQPDRVPIFECVIDEKVMQALKPGCDYYEFNDWIGLDNAGLNRSSWSRDNVDFIDEEKGWFRDNWGVMTSLYPSMPACRVSIPANTNPKPAKAYPQAARRPRPNSRSMAPTKIRGKTISVKLSLNPNRATNQPVTVVPMLAPKMIPSAWGKVSSPAPTKPTAITVVALDD